MIALGPEQHDQIDRPCQDQSDLFTGGKADEEVSPLCHRYVIIFTGKVTQNAGISVVIYRPHNRGDLVQLDIEYVRELPIQDYGEWTNAKAHDWLHPLNGPLPVHHAILHCLGGDFSVAVWDNYNSLNVFLYLLDGDSEASHLVGSMPRTYSWRLKDNTFRCGDAAFQNPKWEGDDREWEKQLTRRVMEESVKLSIRTLIGLRLPRHQHL